MTGTPAGLVSSVRVRIAVFAVVLLVAVGAVAVAFVRAVQDEQQRQQPTAATARDRAKDLGAVLDAPHIVFRSTAVGPTYGMVAAVPLAAPGGDRSVGELSCERVYATDSAGICLQADMGAVTTYRARLLDSRLQPVRELALAGAPSRARLSADGTRATSTVFVSGHSYATVGFVTEAIVYDVADGRSHGNLEKEFRTLIDGKRVTAVDLNVWGVTFAPGPAPTTFYATIATGGRTWLARGDLTARTLTALRQDAECPSLSPDGTKVVYKKRATIGWRYHVLDLRTGTETPLAETRSIDDQAEWLDDETVIYGLQRAGTGSSDVWAVPAAGGMPRVLIPDAWSPAVVRAPAAG